MVLMRSVSLFCPILLILDTADIFFQYIVYFRLVRNPLLNGETGMSPVIKIRRALASGDFGSIPNLARVDTIFFYRPLSNHPLALLFAYDVDELERVTFYPTNLSPTTTSIINHFVSLSLFCPIRFNRKICRLLCRIFFF